MTDPTYASSTNWVNGHGATMTVGSASPGEIKSLSGLGWTASEIDTTVHSSTSNVRSSIPGLVTPNAITVVLRFSKTAATANATLLAANFQTPQSVVISFPFTTPETCTFDAYVSGLSLDIPDDDGVTMTLTLKPTSMPTFA